MREASGASGGHLGGIWRHLGGIWEAPGRHLGGIWETLWELGQPGEPRSDVEEKCAETIVFFHGKWRGRPFRVDETSVGVTKSAACQQKVRGRNPGQTQRRIYRRLRQTARTPQCKHCLGNIYIVIYIYIFISIYIYL